MWFIFQSKDHVCLSPLFLLQRKWSRVEFLYCDCLHTECQMSQDSLPNVDENETLPHRYSLSHFWYAAIRRRCYLVNSNLTLNFIPQLSFFTLIVLNRLSYKTCGLWNYHSLSSHDGPRRTQAPLEWWVIHADQMMLHYKEGWKHSSLTCHSNGVSAVHPSVFLTFCVSVSSLTLWSFWMGGGFWPRTSMVWRGLWLCSGAWYPSPHTTLALSSTWTLVSGTWPSTTMEKKLKRSPSSLLP